jgi:hypothetical protein
VTGRFTRFGLASCVRLGGLFVITFSAGSDHVQVATIPISGDLPMDEKKVIPLLT